MTSSIRRLIFLVTLTIYATISSVAVQAQDKPGRSFSRQFEVPAKARDYISNNDELPSSIINKRHRKNRREARRERRRNAGNDSAEQRTAVENVNTDRKAGRRQGRKDKPHPRRSKVNEIVNGAGIND